MRDTALLNAVVEDIANTHGRLDGLIAAAGVQQETPALEYTADDVNRLLGINVTGVFMTAQAVARQMVRFGRGGSIVLIASMSGTVANRVCPFPSPYALLSLTWKKKIILLIQKKKRASPAPPTTPPKPPSSN